MRVAIVNRDPEGRVRELGSIDDPVDPIGERRRSCRSLSLGGGREYAHGEHTWDERSHGCAPVYISRSMMQVAHMDAALEINRDTWDTLAVTHRRDASGFYHIAAMLAGEDALCPIDAAEIGDLRGLRVAHLQCHIGVDSIYLARRGASVVGLDFSPVAIREARQLAEQANVQVQFVEANVYDAREHLDGEFDRVYTTWGTIVWLPDVRRWARVIASLLRPGGRLYFADGHPSLLCSDMVDGRMTVTTAWRTPADQPLAESGDRSYTGDITPMRHTREWVHPMGDILNALIDAGLRIEWVHEHTAIPWAHNSAMRIGDDRLFRLPADVPQCPLGLSIEATKL